MIAAILKAGKEKGSVLVLAGAIWLVFMGILNPVFYSLIAPGIVKNLAMENASLFYMIAGVIINCLWAGAHSLIAIGILIRPPAVQQQ